MSAALLDVNVLVALFGVRKPGWPGPSPQPASEPLVQLETVLDKE